MRGPQSITWLSEMDSNEENIVIVGGGIAGLSLALALHRLGLRSLVLESSDSLRVTGAAFVTWSNAWRALDALGVGDTLRSKHYQLFRLIVISTESGAPTAQVSYGDQEIRCVKRQTLLETLAKELPTGTIKLSSKVVNIEKTGSLMLLHLADGSMLKTKVLIGCEGVKSVVARWLGFNKPSFTKRFALRGYLDFKEDHGLNQEFLQFTGHGYRYGIIPCNATSLYWFFTWSPSSQDEEIKENPTKMKEFVLRNLGQAQDHIKAIFDRTDEGDIICSPLQYRSPWELFWGDISKDNVCIVGDAFHAMTPDIGQGACATLEDSVILARYLAEAFSVSKTREQNDEYKQFEASLLKYANNRRWRAIDLVATAYIMGSLQQSDGKVVTFIRDKVLASLLAKWAIKKAEFDCRLLS